MKRFLIEVAKMVCAFLALLALSTALNWKTNMDRIDEYRELSGKMDAIAKFLSVEFVKSGE